LRAAGFSEVQAEALIAMRTAAPIDTTHLATKADLAELKADLLKWIVSIISGAVVLNAVIVVSAVIGLVKLTGN
jgi:hypothetical protein